MFRRVMACGIPVFVLAVLWSLAPHNGLSSSRAATSVSTTAATRSLQASAALPKAVAPPKGRPAFNATFSGTQLNTKVWATCYPPRLFGEQNGCTNFLNKEEAEWYLQSQVRVSGGVLNLMAKREATQGTSSPNGPTKEYSCRSGMISSYPSLQFKYGFVQVVAKVAHGNGLWPALWLASANLSYPPEIDMIESWGVNLLTAAYLHPLPAGTYRDRGLIPESLTTGWQTYSLSWTKSKLTFYVANKVVLTVTKSIPHQAMYFIANVAEYLPAKAGNCSGQMAIRSVKIWRY